MGIGLLFTMIVLLGIQGAAYIHDLSRSAANILADNYNSVRYAADMLASADSLAVGGETMESLISNLAKQEKNITETDEFQVTDALKTKVDALRDSVSPALVQAIRTDLYRIMALNMSSIRTKNDALQAEASDDMWYIAAVAALCMAVAFVLLVRFPKAVVRPIDKLKEGIIEIANRNYDKRLDASGNREFAEAAESFNTMAEKLSEYRQSTLESMMMDKKRIEAIVNSLHEPIIGLDPEKNILFVNDEALNILNLDKARIAKAGNATELALTNDLLRKLIRELYADNPDRTPLKIYADNKECYYQMENIPLYMDSSGKGEKTFIGNVIMLADITKFKELDTAKTNFISTVSHEMKTPISSILMSLQLLEDDRLGALNDEQKTLAYNIRESSERLLRITGELLNMTQLETGRLKLMPKVTKPIELINYAVSATRVLAEKFGCFVEVEYPEKISRLFVDSEKIAWVITNLLSNAIHHSPENSRIIVGARQENKTVDIYVQDFGRGIDPRYHKSIFERYFRVPGSKVQGSGLGLAISKEFVEAHGGAIKVESEPGRGSCFTLSLGVL